MPHHDCISALSNISYGTRYRTWRHEATSHLSMSLFVFLGRRPGRRRLFALSSVFLCVSSSFGLSVKLPICDLYPLPSK